jgi:hypothetical protein
MVYGYVSQHPKMAAHGLGALILLSLVLIAVAAVYHHRWKEAVEGGHFTPGIGNFEIPGNNSLWFLGGQDAGSGGSLERPLTPAQMGVYIPTLNRDFQRKVAGLR